MKVKEGKIVEATEAELYSYWLTHFSEIIDFNFYLWRCRELGVKILQKEGR